MDEYVIKQKIQKTYFEPRAPEALIQQVILRTHAVAMGLEAQKQLETAPAEEMSGLTSRALIGQLATVSELPMSTQPEELAHQLEEQPAFQAALRGGNVARRLSSGELMQQIVELAPAAGQEAPGVSSPKKTAHQGVTKYVI